MNKVTEVRKEVEKLDLNDIDKTNLLMMFGLMEDYYKDTQSLNRLDAIQTIYIMNDVFGNNLIDVCVSRDIINKFALIAGVEFTDASVLYVKIDYKKPFSKKNAASIEEMLIPYFDEIGIMRAHGVDKYENSLIFSWNLNELVPLHDDEKLHDLSYKLGLLANLVQNYLDEKIENNPYSTDKVYPRCFLDIFTIGQLNNIVPLGKI